MLTPPHEAETDNANARPRRRMRIALLVAFICAGAMMLMNENAFVQTSHVMAEIRESYDLRSTVNGTLRELALAESAQRGYVLTGDRSYLEPYERSKKRIQEELTSFQSLHSTSPKEQLVQMGELAKAVAQRFGEMDLTIRLRAQDKLDAVNFVVTTNVGLDQMEETRRLADQLFEMAQQRVDSGRSEIFRLLNVTRLGVAAGILAALFAFVLYTQQTRALQRRDEEYKRALEVERDALESQVQERTARLTELATHLQQAVEDERAHLARELHDELGALLTAAKLDVARLKSRVAPGSPEIQDRLQHLTETLNQGIALKRRIIEDLRPSSLSNLGLTAALEILCREFSESSRLEFDIALEPVDLDEASELTIYRMVQESLTNIGKYARASRITVTLKNYVFHAEVSVVDDGVGFDPRTVPQSSHGLMGMRHRIEACGGRLDVSSKAGQGTRVTATIPRRQRKPQAALASAMDHMAVSAHSYSDNTPAPTVPAAPG